MATTEIDNILAKYGPNEPAILEILLDIQKEKGYLSKELLGELSEIMGMPLSRLYRIATFYDALNLEPPGHHLISVCQGTACHLRGAPKILKKIEKELGSTNQDKRFSLETVYCLGCCSLAPVVAINGQIHGRLSSEEIMSLLGE